jgi:hypothetical protein
MLDETFRKLGETLGTMKKEVVEIFEGEKKVDCGKLSIRVKNGDVWIDGQLRELRINGKLVRFAKERP